MMTTSTLAVAGNSTVGVAGSSASVSPKPDVKDAGSAASSSSNTDAVAARQEIDLANLDAIDLAALPVNLRTEAAAIINEIKVLRDVLILVRARDLIIAAQDYLKATFNPAFYPAYEKALVELALGKGTKFSHDKLEKAQIIAETNEKLINEAEALATEQIPAICDTLDGKVDQVFSVLKTLSATGVYPEAKNHYYGQGLVKANAKLIEITNTLEKDLQDKLNALKSSPTGELAAQLLAAHNQGFDPAKPEFIQLTAQGVQTVIDILGKRLIDLLGTRVSQGVPVYPSSAYPEQTVTLSFDTGRGLENMASIVPADGQTKIFNYLFGIAYPTKDNKKLTLPPSTVLKDAPLGTYKFNVLDKDKKVIAWFNFTVKERELTGREKAARFLADQLKLKTMLALGVTGYTGGNKRDDIPENHRAALENRPNLTGSIAVSPTVVGKEEDGALVEYDSVRVNVDAHANFSRFFGSGSNLENAGGGAAVAWTDYPVQPEVYGNIDYNNEAREFPTKWRYDGDSTTVRGGAAIIGLVDIEKVPVKGRVYFEGRQSWFKWDERTRGDNFKGQDREKRIGFEAQARVSQLDPKNPWLPDISAGVAVSPWGRRQVPLSPNVQPAEKSFKDKNSWEVSADVELSNSEYKPGVSFRHSETHYDHLAPCVENEAGARVTVPNTGRFAGNYISGNNITPDGREVLRGGSLSYTPAEEWGNGNWSSVTVTGSFDQYDVTADLPNGTEKNQTFNNPGIFISVDPVRAIVGVAPKREPKKPADKPAPVGPEKLIFTDEVPIKIEGTLPERTEAKKPAATPAAPAATKPAAPAPAPVAPAAQPAPTVSTPASDEEKAKDL